MAEEAVPVILPVKLPTKPPEDVVTPETLIFVELKLLIVPLGDVNYPKVPVPP